MQFRFAHVVGIAALSVAVAHAADAKLSKQQADSFNQKILVIADGRKPADKSGARRTPLSETELNSWFVYSAQPLLPQGLAEPKISIIGQGRVGAEAIVDLDAFAKQKAKSGNNSMLWNYLGGRVPVAITGTLHTKDGIGRFQLESADVSGVPVPKTLLQELVAYYSRTENHPNGVNMDDPFELPAGINRIEVGQGQAVVVQ
jgi:hypothetical protein